MANVRVRMGPRDIRSVYTAYPDCPLKRCFWVAEHMVRSSCGTSGCSSRSSGTFICGSNDQRGCPIPIPDPEEKPRWKRRNGVWELVDS